MSQASQVSQASTQSTQFDGMSKKFSFADYIAGQKGQAKKIYNSIAEEAPGANCYRSEEMSSVPSTNCMSNYGDNSVSGSVSCESGSQSNEQIDPCAVSATVLPSGQWGHGGNTLVHAPAEQESELDSDSVLSPLPMVQLPQSKPPARAPKAPGEILQPLPGEAKESSAAADTVPPPLPAARSSSTGGSAPYAIIPQDPVPVAVVAPLVNPPKDLNPPKAPGKGADANEIPVQAPATFDQVIAAVESYNHTKSLYQNRLVVAEKIQRWCHSGHVKEVCELLSLEDSK